MSQAAISVSAAPNLRWLNAIDYWGGIPFRWARQALRNGTDILRVLDTIKFRPLGPGLVSIDHPWVTGIEPETGELIWPKNVVYSTPRKHGLADDQTVLYATGKFMAGRVRQSAVLPELPIGPKRRMPHAVNYMHGSSHYNSGIILLNDLTEGFRHLSDLRFRRDIRDFVRRERREVLFVFRDREYDPREFAWLSCCMRTYFHWFCNPNGPQQRVLWGNAAPFAAANLITGHWADDVYALKSPDGAAVVARPPIATGAYFQNAPYYGSRDQAGWPEKILAKANDLRIRLRGAKGGMFFVDRRRVYEDQIQNRVKRGLHQDHRRPL